MADFKSAAVADFIPESVAGLLRNQQGAAAGVRKVKARGSCGGRGSRKARGSRGAWKPFDGLAPVATK
jgi:hypothetical protein